MHVGTENRLFERIDGNLGVRYSPQGSNKEFCTTTKNISGGGIRIALLKKLSPGTKLDIEIFKYDIDMKTRCRGKIVWVWQEPMNRDDDHYFESGISFIDNQPLSIGRLISYLSQKQETVL